MSLRTADLARVLKAQRASVDHLAATRPPGLPAGAGCDDAVFQAWVAGYRDALRSVAAALLDDVPPALGTAIDRFSAAPCDGGQPHADRSGLDGAADYAVQIGGA